MGDDLLGDAGLVQVGGGSGRHLHGDILGVTLEGGGVGSAFYLKADHDADAAAAVDVGLHIALVADKAADLQILADGDDLLLQGLVNGGGAASDGAGQQGVHIGGVLIQDGLGAILHELDKGGVLGDKVGLGVDLNDHAHLLLLVLDGADNALGSDAAGLLGDLGKALLPQQVDGLLHVAVGLGQRLFAVHHAAAGGLAKILYILGGKSHSRFLLYHLYFFPENARTHWDFGHWCSLSGFRLRRPRQLQPLPRRRPGRPGGPR